MRSVIFDTLKNIRVGLTLPLGKILPIGHIRRLWSFNVLMDLSDPAQGHETASLFAGQLCGAASANLHEGPHLLVDGGSSLAFPFGRLLPGSDVGRLGFARV